MLYPDRAAIERIHHKIHEHMQVTRGRPNYGKVDLILEKPQLKLFGTEKYGTIYEKAACLLEGFCRGHAFPDGNKRTSLLVAFTFLRANEHYLAVPVDVIEYLVGVARNEAQTEGEIDALVSGIADWLEERTATDRKGYAVKCRRFFLDPLEDLIRMGETEAGRAQALEKLDRWFATEYHPEYRQGMPGTISFMADMAGDARRALEMPDK